MQVELDHLFVCTSAGGPEGEKLIQFGLKEAPPNKHPGQGTANRRFAFFNAMIELPWVENPVETQNEITAGTTLWERWSGRLESACPFGVCVRPSGMHGSTPPFPGWDYRLAYLPPPLSMDIGEAGIEEPMWVYLSFLTRSQRQLWFQREPAGVREITRVTLYSPAPPRSATSRKLVEDQVVQFEASSTYCLVSNSIDGGRDEKLISGQTCR